MKRALLALMLSACVAASAAAEALTSVTLTSAVGVSRIAGGAAASAVSTGELDVSAAASRNVKAELELEATVGNGAAITVPRAYVKVRLPWFRFMIGKSRVSFGRGFFFDAGDVIFGGAGLAVADFSASVLRDDTTWLAEAYLPLGSFSYLEGVFLPYLGPGGIFGTPATTALVQDLTQLVAPVDLRTVSAGARLVFRAAGIDFETGYLFNGSGGLHLPYVGAAGSLLVDWYLGASATIPASAADWQNTGRRLALSGGLFHLFRFGGDASFAARLEGLALPGGQWHRVAGGISPVDLSPATVSGGAVTWPGPTAVSSTFSSRYGLYLFPEVDYSPSQSVALQLRAIVSPIDASASLITGVGWNVYQGLTLRAFLYSMVGADDAAFGWNQPGGIGAALAAEMIF